jgi:Ran GTPase-activating protein (RanGAP) involved in mRNA processing and transport
MFPIIDFNLNLYLGVDLSLEMLWMENCNITDEGARLLAEPLPTFKGLRELNLIISPFGAPGGK